MDSHAEIPFIKAEWQKEKCLSCRRCHAEWICPMGALKVSKGTPKHVEVRLEKCIGCGKCLKACPGEAFEMTTK